MDLSVHKLEGVAGKKGRSRGMVKSLYILEVMRWTQRDREYRIERLSNQSWKRKIAWLSRV
jgi:hypothetical protein